eukprot:comp4951_c0_seq1/m.1043 comp4951_c0_seq1/g.1043  ORF comp4951_c0_seq1/g.1043 comp4951_c0_seq1/m.1043 type:complete len:288 (-) comp4951_c0_seq1:21-884(-)
MIRRQARLRKEYLYRKALEEKEKQTAERKRKLKEAIKAGKPIPTELRKEESSLRHEIELEDINTEVVRDHIDDEYAFAGVRDPKVVITTARDPSSRLAQFAKEFKLLIPNAQRLNRGNFVVKELVDTCRSNDITDLLILHEHRGEPDGLIVCHLPYGPTAYFALSNVVMRHDVKEFTSTMSEQYPHLIFNNFTTTLGNRVQNILKYLYPVPKESSTRVMAFANDSDYISFRHHTFKKDGKDVVLSEIGPRFEMKVYQIKLGTVDQAEADTEWVAKPYMNTAKKRNYL